MSVLSLYRRITACALILLFLCTSTFSAAAQSKEERRLYRKGAGYTLNSHWDKAINTFGKLLSKYPDTRYTDSHFWIGYSYSEIGKYNKAITRLQSFAKEYPSSSYAPQALYRVGEIYEKKMKDYDKALQAYDRVINRYPKANAALPAAQNQAAITAQRKYKYDQAIERYQRAKSIAKKQSLSVSREYERKADRRIRFIKANSDHNYEPLRLFSIGVNKEEKKKWNEALGIYDALLNKYPDANISDDAAYRAILCLMRMGNRLKAYERSKQFLKKYPESPYTGKVKGRIMDMLKNGGDIRNRPVIYFV